MRRASAVVLAAGLVAVGWPAPARADETRSAHVLGQGPIADRVADELRAASGRVAHRRAPLEIGCSRPLVEAELSRSAPGSVCVCVDADGVGTWQWDGDLAVQRDAFRHPEVADPRVASVRAAEAARAALASPSLAGAVGDASLLDAPLDPPGGQLARPSDDAEKRLLAASLRRGVERGGEALPNNRIGIGLSGVGGRGGARLGLTLDVDIALRPGVVLSAMAAIPTSRFAMDRRNAETRASLSVVGVALTHPLASAGAWVKPRVGGGVGVAWLAVDTTATATPSDPLPPRTTTSDLVSPLGYVTLGASLRVVGPVRLSADVFAGATATRFVVRDPTGAELGEWGWPLAGASVLGALDF